jgi:hypothetical protein
MARFRGIILAYTDHGVIAIGRHNGAPFNNKFDARQASNKLEKLFKDDNGVAFELHTTVPLHAIIKMGEAVAAARDDGSDQRVADTDGDEDLLSAPTPIPLGSGDKVSEVSEADAEAEGLPEEGQPVQSVPTGRTPGEARGDFDIDLSKIGGDDGTV